MAMSVRTCSPTSPLLVRHTLTVVMRNFPPVAPIRCAYTADLHALTKQYLRVRVVKYVRIVLRSDTSDRVRHPKASSQPPDHLHAKERKRAQCSQCVLREGCARKLGHEGSPNGGFHGKFQRVVRVESDECRPALARDQQQAL